MPGGGVKIISSGLGGGAGQIQFRLPFIAVRFSPYEEWFDGGDCDFEFRFVLVALEVEVLVSSPFDRVDLDIAIRHFPLVVPSLQGFA